MANFLTGDYATVIQVSTRQINGLLATIHQNGATKGAALSFPHSLTIQIDDRSSLTRLGVEQFGKWFSSTKAQFILAAIEANAPATVHAEFSTLPPGAAVALAGEFGRWYETGISANTTGRAVGRALVQCSSPIVHVQEGAIGELTSSVFIRALYFREPGSRQFGEPIHGEVRVTYRPQPLTLPSGETVFDIPFPADDSKIRFLPEAGTVDPAEAAAIEKQLRETLRKGFKPMRVGLSADFPFAQFKGVGAGGGGQALAIALPAPSPDNVNKDIDSINTAFLGTSDFAIAVSKEAIVGMLDGFLTQVRTAIAAQRPEFLGATYSVRFSAGPTLTLEHGKITVSARVEAETSAFLLPNGFISFSQDLTLQLDPLTQLITLQAIGDPIVDESWFISHERALGIVRSQRDAALAPASVGVQNALAAARNSLNQALWRFDPSATAKYKSVAIRPDGVIVAGDIDTKYHYRPVVTFGETPDGTHFTAFESWIPGGRITNYHWSWVEALVFKSGHGVTFSMAYRGRTKSSDVPHSFVFEKPHGVFTPSRICLRVDGTQINSNGDAVAISEGRTCKNSSFEPMLTLPPGWEKVFIAKWWPDPPPDGILRDSILGHLDVVSTTRTPGGSGINTLVYFCDWRATERPMEGVFRGLSEFPTQEAQIAVTVVLPPGGLSMTRREFERRLGPMEPSEVREGRAPVVLEFAEDTLGGWADVFGSSAMPALYLINAHGEYAWKHEGEVDPERLASALRRHTVPVEQSRSRLLSLTVQPGQPLPDAYFVDDRQENIFLARFQGTSLLVCFWQIWSDACRLELRRLQELLNRAEPGSLAVIGLCPDADPDQLRDIRERNRITFVLGHDKDRQIARQFGVRFWPTTVSVSPSQIVDSVHHSFPTDSRSDRPAESA